MSSTSSYQMSPVSSLMKHASSVVSNNLGCIVDIPRVVFIGLTYGTWCVLEYQTPLSHEPICSLMMYVSFFSLLLAESITSLLKPMISPSAVLNCSSSNAVGLTFCKNTWLKYLVSDMSDLAGG